MKKLLSLFICTTLLFSNINIVQSNAITREKVVSVSNLKINNGNGALDLTEDLDEVKSLEEGTVITRFYKSKSGVMSLIGASNNNTASGYITVYINGDILGVEIRTQTGTTVTNLDHVSVTKKMNTGMNTLAVKVTKNDSYKLFLNGELVKHVNDTTTNFFNSVDGVNTLFVGKTARGGNGNNYNYTGAIDFVDVYSEALPDDEIINITSETKLVESEYYPENTFISDAIPLFKQGDFRSNYFRIPSLLTTTAGTVIAGIDVRYSSSNDSPNNIDAGIKRKERGKEWDEGQIVMDFPNNASVIDMSLLQDKSTNRIFMLMTHFPNGYGFKNSKTGSGYTEIDGVRYRSLYDNQGAVFTIREEGKVYNSANELTNYVVDDSYNLRQNGVLKGNIVGGIGPLKVYETSYLLLTYSDDDGETWSEPRELNKDVKLDWMRFLGTAPGNGIQIKNGDKAGRLVFPVYLTNAPGFQSSAVIYSDDNGDTWELGETATDGRDMGNGVIGNAETTTSGTQLTECQVVEMPDGQLKLFMRNSGTYVRVATSFDGGATWDNDVVEDKNLREPYCQLSVINYSKPIEGKPAVIFSNPNASSRVNGTIRVGLINENGTHENGRTKYEFEWRYQKGIKEGMYAYSSLTELENGDIGVLYEPDVTFTNYQEMSIDYLKFNIEDHFEASKIKDVELIDSDNYYIEGDEINVKVTYDSKSYIIGDKNISISVGDNNINLEYVKNDDNITYYYKGIVDSELTKGEYTISILPNKLTEIYNISNKINVMDEKIDTDIKVLIKYIEDINNDNKVDILDLSALGLDYNLVDGDIKYNSQRDINKDKVIDLYDLVLVSKKIK